MPHPPLLSQKQVETCAREHKKSIVLANINRERLACAICGLRMEKHPEGWVLRGDLPPVDLGKLPASSE